MLSLLHPLIISYPPLHWALGPSPILLQQRKLHFQSLKWYSMLRASICLVVPLNSENKLRGLYFSKAFFEGLIFGGAYIRRGLSTEGNLRFKIDLASLIFGRKFTVFALFFYRLCFALFLRAISKYKPLGGLYLKERFNGGFFCVTGLGWGGGL